MMTVKDLIQELLELDMESDIEIVANNGLEWDTFSDIRVDSSYQISGRVVAQIHFQTEDMAFIDNKELDYLRSENDDLENKIEELEEKISELEEE